MNSPQSLAYQRYPHYQRRKEAEMAAATLFETPQKLAATTEQGYNKGDRVALGTAGTFKLLDCWMKPRPAEEDKEAKNEQKPEQSPTGKGNAKKDQNQSQGDKATPRRTAATVQAAQQAER